MTVDLKLLMYKKLTHLRSKFSFIAFKLVLLRNAKKNDENKLYNQKGHDTLENSLNFKDE